MPGQLLVRDEESVDGLDIARDVLDDLLPIRNRLGVVAEVFLQKTSDALDDVKLLAR